MKLKKVGPILPEHMLADANSRAAEVELPADLLAARMLQEGRGNNEAVSGSGAVGLMEVMPRHEMAASFECINTPTDRWM